MPEQGFNSEQVCPIFIEMCAKCMAERMAGQAMGEAKFRFFGKNKLVYRIRSHRAGGVIAVREEEAGRLAGKEPVLGEDIQSIVREDGVTVRACFGMADMDAHGGAADVVVAEGTNFADAEACGIHK